MIIEGWRDVSFRIPTVSAPSVSQPLTCEFSGCYRKAGGSSTLFLDIPSCYIGIINPQHACMHKGFILATALHAVELPMCHDMCSMSSRSGIELSVDKIA